MSFQSFLLYNSLP